MVRRTRRTLMTKKSAAQKAWMTRRTMAVWERVHAAEAASKSALASYCKKHGWHVAFFEGKTGAPRTGIIDAVVFRIARGKPDRLDLRLVQLKGGRAGASGAEIKRLKKAVTDLSVDWLIAAYDGKVLHLVSDLDD
jgi:hypothetical protein